MTTEKSFIDSKIYPIIFIIILTAFFTGMLAFFYHSTKERVQLYSEQKFQESILYLFEIPVVDSNQTQAIFNNHIKTLIQSSDKDSIKYYQASKDEQVLGYAFVIHGNGLWGSIEAIIAFSADLNTLLNFYIIQQNETPGLGARITENWFLKQFSGIPLFVDGQVKDIRLIDENEQSNSVYDVRRVTGATSSTKAVVNMILEESKKIKETIRID